MKYLYSVKAFNLLFLLIYNITLFSFSDGLVVVASLIDRIPNLGGLARTCEIFGVSEYIVESIKFIEDKQFTSLSVTAEKWVTIKEVNTAFYFRILLENRSIKISYRINSLFFLISILGILVLDIKVFIQALSKFYLCDNNYGLAMYY